VSLNAERRSRFYVVEGEEARERRSSLQDSRENLALLRGNTGCGLDKGVAGANPKSWRW